MAKKMKITKRVLTLLLTLSLTAGLLGNAALAADMSSDRQIVKQGDRVYYLSDPKEGEVAGENNFDVWTSKTIAGTENEDEFEVTLQVGTTIKPVPNDVAVVLVMDASGSMMMDKTGKKWGDHGALPTDGTKLRIDYAREAALEFAEQLAENSGGAQRMVSVVEFGNNAKTVLPWTDANDNGTLRESVAEAISSVDVNFVYDNRSFWDEEALETLEVKSYSTLVAWGGVLQYVKAENWSDEEYTHETESFYEASFESYDRSFMTDDHCAYDGCTSTEADHTHCAYEGCASTDVGHKHCSVCGVTDVEAPADAHCTYAGCEETAEHTHCTYSICANPTGHEHCERRCQCDQKHDHCWDIQEVCGRTDEHTHIKGCGVFYCQDTTPNHKHACLHGIMMDGKKYNYALYDYKGGSTGNAAYHISTARCLNSDPNHTHDVYDGDNYNNYNYMILDRIHQQYYCIATNMEGGLMLARNLVNTGKAEGGAIEGIDDVYVVLLSDGIPTYHVNQDQLQNADTEVEFIIGELGGGSYAKMSDLEDIVSDGTEGDVAVVEDIKFIADFYAIMYGTEMDGKMGYNRSGVKKVDHALAETTAEEWFLTSNDSDAGIVNQVGADAVFSSPEIDQLNTVFANIKDRIDVMAKAWTVADEISDDVTFGEFTLNGDYAGYTPASGDGEASVSWALGRMDPESGNGTVEDPYIYTMKYTVKLKSAKDNVKAASLAHDADPTLEGVWTGENTALQYLMVEEEQLDALSPDEIRLLLRDAAFESVSVKGIYGDYTFVKKNGETGAVMPGAGFTLYDSEGNAYGEEVFSDSEGKVDFTNIPRGVYTLKETTVPDGMQEMPVLGLQVSWGVLTAAAGSDAPADIYNWEVAKVDISGTKIWNDGNDRDGIRPESITIRLYADGVEVDSKTVTAADGWAWRFTEKNQYDGNGRVIDYTITEDAVSKYTASISDDKDIGGSFRYDVTNTYSYSRPTVVNPVTPPTEEDLPDEDVPGADAPAEDPAEDPVEEDEILDEEVPKADVPATGDMTALWAATGAISAAGLLFLGKKRKKEE